MSLRPLTSTTPWDNPLSDPLRVTAAWHGANGGSNDEVLQLAGWLGKSVPLAVQVVAPATWASSTPATGKKFKKLLRDQSEAFAATARTALEEYVEEEMWALEPARMMASTSESSSLTRAADELDAHMILLGSRARKPKGTLLVSSLVDSLLESTTKPLLIVPQNLKLSKKGVTRVNYIFPGRNGLERNAGLWEATALARRIGVPIRLIAISPDTLTGSDLDASLDTPNTSAQWYESALGKLDHARDAVIDAAHALDPPADDGLVVEVAVAVDHGWKKAVHSVKWKKGDLACLAVRPTTQLKWVFGKAHPGKFLRHVPAPALIFPYASA
ncbi:universal stress protein [Corynebacterium mycetoides]|uniref:universal stress protein n=1 Tax=Corynebacterium mycetoides TaxID=38302 RepID=UPI000B8367F9|nr:universal stress protein [Corynebacterium mycetoides]